MYAIHIIATSDYSATREWFDCEFQMHQRLCGGIQSVYAYAADGGLIKNSNGRIVGRWFETAGGSKAI